MTLQDVQPNHFFQIQDIADPNIRVQAIRWGLCKGTTVQCIERIPGGPVVVQFANQQIAIGRRLAHQIRGELVEKLQLEASQVVVS